MLKILIEKELKAILLSPKFVVTFSVCSLLILLSVFVGIQEYKAAVAQYDAVNQLAEQELREQTSLMGLSTRVHRQPDPMQIFVSGVHYDIGRLSAIHPFLALKLTNSVYSDDPIFAAFRFIDFSFIVQIVLSLFAILFTYDAISGERESGMLKLNFSNAVPRARYVITKFVGAWLGLVVPLLIPILMGLLLIVISGVPLTTEHWAKILLLLAAALLFFTFFVALGLLVSALTRHSSVSFLVSLVLWVFLVLIVPRAAVMAAGQVVQVPSIAEIESQQDGFAKALWQSHSDDLTVRWRQREAEMAGLSREERAAYRDEHLWEWMEEEDAARKGTQSAINEHSLKLQEELRNRKAGQERLAFSLSRISPVSALQLAAMNAAGTNIDLKSRYEDAMQNYRAQFIDYREKKQEDSGGHGGLRIEFNTDTGFKFDLGRDKGTLNLSDMPKFDPPKYPMSVAVESTTVDLGLLALYTLLTFAGAFAAFLRYDLR
ncbi:MAG TPA: ABC transporter permease subunit [bacterium]